MRVAVLISGRLRCYERCLIPLLQKANYDIDLFCSINDEDGPYYEEARKNLEPWLKGLYINKYTFPERFDELYIAPPPAHTKPIGQMSMFFNDRNAFDMAVSYAEENNFEYDSYMKYRADVQTSALPDVVKSSEFEIYSVIPWCNYTVPLLVRETPSYLDGDLVDWVSDAIVFGNRKSMEAYTDTHNFCLEMTELFRGEYPCNFEPSVTQNAYDKELKINYFNRPYTLDPSRH